MASTETPETAKPTSPTDRTEAGPSLLKQVDIDSATRETLEEAERDLAELIARKRGVDKSLASIEANIYALEGAYLEDTHLHGNIIRGFDGYLNTRVDRKKQRFTEQDRLFSQSSVTYLKALEMREREELERNDDVSPDSPVPKIRSTPLKKIKKTLFATPDTERKKKKIRLVRSDEE
ncbi:histone acetyltransferase subunit NuA4-domain-containing protein [Polychytrium aggregatum]|uniref:histone acetyltransferase subunit NuA4-domain-containing protein n=1 Tax=Polychytrium aggregatum TaxID=110093 RepID=UPI0022FE6C23|nr:histone acetyltransferase subunit NuA4-domain-containing protein [Polychytrium aggregatum]KAI9209719.1 histone acetyltransferase subunit NuA4-domain-containing protein [Polychytrium aggregatum]